RCPEPVCGCDARAKAGTARGLGVETVASEDHLHRESKGQRTRQALGSACGGNDRALGLRKPEARVLRRDADIAGESQLESAREAVAVNRGDDWLPALEPARDATERHVVAGPLPSAGERLSHRH